MCSWNALINVLIMNFILLIKKLLVDSYEEFHGETNKKALPNIGKALIY